MLLVLSHVTLKERIGRNEWIAISLIAITLLCISLSLDLSTDRAGDSAPFGALVAAALPTILVGALFFMGADRLRSGTQLHTNARAGLYGVGTGLIYGVGALAVKSVSTIVEKHGLWQSIPHVLASPYLYTFATASGLGLLLFQTALQRCPASVIVPASNVVSATYVVAVGSVIFGEQLPTTAWKLVLRVIGFAGVFLGVLLLANTKPAAPEMPLIEEPVSLPLPLESTDAGPVEAFAEIEGHRDGAEGGE